MDLAPGTLIAGQYRVERKIAEGGMGEVWIGMHAGGERVAIKRLLPEAARDHYLITRFKREAYLLSRIRSNHVTQVVEFITDESFGMLLVMEYVEGDNLADMLEGRHVLSVEETLDIGIDLAHAIADLHRANLIHRDLKPENIIFRRLPSGERRAVIIDFGLSRLIDQPEERPAGEETLTGITRADSAIGTIAYMAPEQLISSRDVNQKADIYALGAILYRAAAGKNVFGCTDDMAYARQKLHEEAQPLDLARFDRSARALERIVTRALRRRPAERYQTIEAMLSDLMEARAGQVHNPEVEAPTQTVPVASLLGMPASALLDLAATGHPEAAAPQNQIDSLESMETLRTSSVAPVAAPPAFPQPPPSAPTEPRVVVSATTTMTMTPQTPIADRLPSMRFAPPPVPPPAIPDLGRPPPPRLSLSSDTDVRALHGTASYPDANPSAHELRIPKTVAAVVLVATLAGGMVLGFLLHALFF
jgi:serine/threonine-protein kinase